MCPFQEAEAIIQKIKQQQYSDLLAHDQLLLERKEQKVFLHFGEGTLSLLCTLPTVLSLPDDLTRGGAVSAEEGSWPGGIGEAKLGSLCLFQRRRRSPSPPPTDSKG